MVTYAPRVQVHPDRTGPAKTFGPNRLFVLHTSEQTGETVGSAENLAKAMTRPGDRPSPGGVGMFGASYQYVVDTDQVIPCTPENVVSYSAAGANIDGIHICFPGRAGQTREQWLDEISRAYIARCAELLVDRTVPTAIPLVRLTVADVRGGVWGVCDHYDVSRAFGRSDHTDVGPGFPWDVLWADVDLLLHPPPPPEPEPPEPPKTTEVDMLIIHRRRNTAEWDAMIWTGTHLSGARSDVSLDALRSAGVQEWDVPDDEVMDRIINSGQTTNDCPPTIATDARLSTSWNARRA